MKFAKALSLSLAIIFTASCATSCGVPNRGTSITASADTERYVTFLQDRLTDMPDELVIAAGCDTAKYGVDMSAYADSEGYYIRADGGDVVILGKTDAGLDRAVRQYAKYGNKDSYTYTYGESYRVQSLTVMGNDISEYAVVRPDDADECMTYASSELVKYISKACGAVLPEYTESEYTSAEAKTAKAITLSIDYPAHGDEAFSIEVKDDGNVDILCGRYRGGLYGVYGLLEDMGWRFLGDNIEYLYEADCVDLTDEINRTENGAVPNRFTSDRSFTDYVVGSKSHYHGRYLSSSATAKYGFYGIISEACHGLDANGVDWQGTYAGIKSEGKQPCFTDEDILQAIEDHFRKIIEAKLAAGLTVGKEFCYIDVAQFDTTQFCQCPDCLEVLAEEGSNSGAVLRMTNRMADMAAEYNPEISVLMLAYAGTNKPPKITVPRDNVKISYCFYTGNSGICCSNHPISGEECVSGGYSNKGYAAEFEEWKKICKSVNLQVWYYPLNCYEVAFQIPCFDTAYADMQYLIDADVSCVMLCAGENNDTILLSAISEILWNGDMTEEEYWDMVEEYFYIVYGESGKYIHEYTMMLQTAGDLEDCWCAFHTRVVNKVDDLYMATNFDYMTGLFKEALRLAETEEIEQQIEILMARMFYACITVTHEDLYVNGTDEERALIAERYTELHRIFRKYDIAVFDDYINYAVAPEELDLEVNPSEAWCIY